jgi:hypothetical protein
MRAEHGLSACPQLFGRLNLKAVIVQSLQALVQAHPFLRFERLLAGSST